MLPNSSTGRAAGAAVSRCTTDQANQMRWQVARAMVSKHMPALLPGAIPSLPLENMHLPDAFGQVPDHNGDTPFRPLPVKAPILTIALSIVAHSACRACEELTAAAQ
jgi:hypothetical protein